MLENGVYYFWLTRSYPWGDIGRSITQWVYVGLNAKICSPGQIAFAAKITHVQRQPWGYTCRSSTSFTEERRNDFSIQEQLDLIRKDIKNQVQLHELAAHLRPLEGIKYWSSELRSLLEEYLSIEEEAYQEGLRRKSEWLIKFIEKTSIDLYEEGLRFSIESYGRSRARRIRVDVPSSFKNPAAEWLIRRISIKPKNRGRVRRIQPPDVVLFYPVFKILIRNIEELVQSLGIESDITRRWGSL